MHIGDNPGNVGLIIEVRPQCEGYDTSTSLVLWTGETKPVWEKNFLLVRVRQNQT